MENDLTEKQQDDLEFFSRVEGTEIGETIGLLLEIAEYEDYIRHSNIIEEAKKELQGWHNYYMKNIEFYEEDITVRLRKMRNKDIKLDTIIKERPLSNYD